MGRFLVVILMFRDIWSLFAIAYCSPDSDNACVYTWPSPTAMIAINTPNPVMESDIHDERIWRGNNQSIGLR